jgi:hypothetical protein
MRFTSVEYGMMCRYASVGRGAELQQMRNAMADTFIAGKHD